MLQRGHLGQWPLNSASLGAADLSPAAAAAAPAARGNPSATSSINAAAISTSLTALRGTVTAGKAARLRLGDEAGEAVTGVAWHGILELTRIWGSLVQSLSGVSVSAPTHAAAGALPEARQCAGNTRATDQPNEPAADGSLPRNSSFVPRPAVASEEGRHAEADGVAAVSESDGDPAGQPSSQAHGPDQAVTGAALRPGTVYGTAAEPRLLPVLPTTANPGGADLRPVAGNQGTAPGTMLCPKCHKRRAAQLDPAPAVGMLDGAAIERKACGQHDSSVEQRTPGQHDCASMLSGDRRRRTYGDDASHQSGVSHMPASRRAPWEAESNADAADNVSPATSGIFEPQSPLSDISAADTVVAVTVS